MAEKPLCDKCQGRHWRFDSCANAPARDAADARKEANRREAYPLKSVPDGYRVWGQDDLPSWNRQGNTYWRKPTNDDSPKAA